MEGVIPNNIHEVKSLKEGSPFVKYTNGATFGGVLKAGLMAVGVATIVTGNTARVVSDGLFKVNELSSAYFNAMKYNDTGFQGLGVTSDTSDTSVVSDLNVLWQGASDRVSEKVTLENDVDSGLPEALEPGCAQELPFDLRFMFQAVKDAWNSDKSVNTALSDLEDEACSSICRNYPTYQQLCQRLPTLKEKITSVLTNDDKHSIASHHLCAENSIFNDSNNSVHNDMEGIKEFKANYHTSLHARNGDNVDKGYFSDTIDPKFILKCLPNVELGVLKVMEAATSAICS